MFNGLLGGGKAKQLLTDPIVENVVSLIQPHVEAFINPYDNNEDSDDELDTQLRFEKHHSAGKYSFIPLYLVFFGF